MEDSCFTISIHLKRLVLEFQVSFISYFRDSESWLQWTDTPCWGVCLWVTTWLSRTEFPRGGFSDGRVGAWWWKGWSLVMEMRIFTTARKVTNMFWKLMVGRWFISFLKWSPFLWTFVHFRWGSLENFWMTHLYTPEDKSKNWWLVDVSPFPRGYFSGSMLVFGGGTCFSINCWSFW